MVTVDIRKSGHPYAQPGFLGGESVTIGGFRPSRLRENVQFTEFYKISCCFGPEFISEPSGRRHSLDGASFAVLMIACK